MNQKRIRKTELNLVVGNNGSGKSTWLKKNVIEKAKKALIVTPHSHEWKQYPTISTAKEIRQLQGIARLIYCEGEEILEKINENFYGGVLVLDDAPDYLSEQTPKVLNKIYVGRRQRGIDIYFVGQGMRRIPPKAFTYISFLILFNTTENFIERKKDILPDLFDKIVEAQKELAKLNLQGNTHEYRIFLFDQQIRGEYVRQAKQTK